MDTREHTELGNTLRFTALENNPYLRVDEQGTLYLKLQRHSDDGVPQTMNLEMSAGEIIAMAGDFFTDANWAMKLDLPSCHNFKMATKFSEHSSETLGEYLIKQPVTQAEEQALLKAYNNLASPDVNRAAIDKIYKIDGSTYIPFSATLNDYAKQLMFYLRVKDYGEMLNRNQTHFTPWSVRVYTLGHHLALKYARLSCELNQLATNEDYQSTNAETQNLMRSLQEKEGGFVVEHLQDLAHRYQALALEMELFTFHYYSDHFAAGHMSMVGDLRVLLTERFGVWGSILANNLHNELNRVGVYTKRFYDPTPNPTEAPTTARGDGDFNTCLNHFNKNYCLAGMQSSIQDLNNVLAGNEIPEQWQYGGLEHLPDADFNYRQHQPLILLGDDNKIYYREQLAKIKTLSPADYEALRAVPYKHGYNELESKWDAFALTAKLRLLPFIYTGQIQQLTTAERSRIENEERWRNPERESIPLPPCAPENSPTIEIPSWRSPVTNDQLIKGLAKHGLLALDKQEVRNSATTEIELTAIL